jgi:hypothetical protein
MRFGVVVADVNVGEVTKLASHPESSLVVTNKNNRLPSPPTSVDLHKPYIFDLTIRILTAFTPNISTIV